MIKIKIAIHAFFTILLSKKHVYSSHNFTSISGELNEVISLTNAIIEPINEKTNQSNLLKVAKDLITKNL